MTLSKEKLAHYAMHKDGSVKAMARELLERRGRDKQEPDGWQFLGVNGLWVNVTENGMRQALKEGSEVRALYAAPQLPQPAAVDDDKLRAAFERWMVEDEKCIVGSFDPYPAGIESRNWRAWNACRAAILQGAEPVSQPDELPEVVLHMGQAISVFEALKKDLLFEHVRHEELGAMGALNVQVWTSILGGTLRYEVSNGGCTLRALPMTIRHESHKSNAIGTYQGADGKEHPVVNFGLPNREGE